MSRKKQPRATVAFLLHSGGRNHCRGSRISSTTASPRQPLYYGAKERRRRSARTSFVGKIFLPGWGADAELLLMRHSLQTLSASPPEGRYDQSPLCKRRQAAQALINFRGEYLPIFVWQLRHQSLLCIRLSTCGCGFVARTHRDEPSGVNKCNDSMRSYSRPSTEPKESSQRCTPAKGLAWGRRRRPDRVATHPV